MCRRQGCRIRNPWRLWCWQPGEHTGTALEDVLGSLPHGQEFRGGLQMWCSKCTKSGRFLLRRVWGSRLLTWGHGWLRPGRPQVLGIHLLAPAIALDPQPAVPCQRARGSDVCIYGDVRDGAGPLVRACGAQWCHMCGRRASRLYAVCRKSWRLTGCSLRRLVLTGAEQGAPPRFASREGSDLAAGLAALPHGELRDLVAQQRLWAPDIRRLPRQTTVVDRGPGPENLPLGPELSICSGRWF
mmetsp:Transcript_6207/g.15230  ORF Transcript_6207/g.15230 Transcript_6207/m.15230 type:complete len:242 (+) Transcript_6207:118-843(+)